jgi:hypothetical protein
METVFIQHFRTPVHTGDNDTEAGGLGRMVEMNEDRRQV